MLHNEAWERSAADRASGDEISDLPQAVSTVISSMRQWMYFPGFLFICHWPQFWLNPSKLFL